MYGDYDGKSQIETTDNQVTHQEKLDTHSDEPQS